MLPQYLNEDRFDAIFLAETVFLQLLKDYQMDLNRYKQVVEVEKLFGIYIAKKYLKNQPEFMNKLNSAILENKSTPISR